MSKKVLWFVCSGIDIGHFWETKPFDKLNDAKEYAINLPKTPLGNSRPYHIERWEYNKADNYWNETASSRIVERNY